MEWEAIMTMIGGTVKVNGPWRIYDSIVTRTLCDRGAL